MAQRSPWPWLAFSLVACLGVWYWAARTLVPVNTAAALSQGRPIGNNSDLYPRWVGARELLLNRRDPYSVEVTSQIQQGYYGRTLDRTKPSDPADESAFAYPLYVVFLLAPFVRLPFSEVMAFSSWVLLAGAGLTVPLWMSAAGLRCRWQIVLAGMLLAAGSYPVVMIFYKQQLTALVVLLLAATAGAVRRGWLSLSGMLLAFATIKPQLSVLPIIWFLFWAATRWHERKRILLSFGVWMGGLLAGAHLLSPGWMSRFISSAREYRQYAADPSLLQVIFTYWGGLIVASALLLWLAWFCWKRRASDAQSRDFFWAIAATATVTLVILPKLAPYNQLFLVPAFIALLGGTERPSSARSKAHTLRVGLFACQAWQWITAMSLAFASLFLRVETLRRVASAPLLTLYAIPLLAIAVVVVSVTGEARQPATSGIPCEPRE